jgi:PAS domain S-box-containing protein
MTASPTIERIPLLSGDSEMAQRVRALDWSATGLGSVEQWPQVLRTSVNICLGCAFPAVVWWGPELVTFYNDACQPVLGEKHPWALGQPASMVWHDDWDVIEPMLASVRHDGGSTGSRDILLRTGRYGIREECRFCFSCSPIADDKGGLGGVFCSVIETAEGVVGERRIRTLRDLAAPWHWCRFDPLPDGGVANHFQEITEKRRSEERLRIDERRAAADLAGMVRLQEVSTRLVGAADATPLLLDIVDAAVALTGADMGNIQLWDAQLGALRMEASLGFDGPFLERFDVVRDDEAACGTAMRTSTRVVVEDVEESPIFVGTPALAALRAAGVRAVQSTPLVDRSGRLVGMLSTHYRAPRLPAERDLRFLDTLAREAADFIERSGAERALRASEERFRRYFELGLIGMVMTSPMKGCMEVNDRACEIFGYSREEMLRLTWAELTHPDDLSVDRMHFERLLSGEIDGYRLDKRFIRRDGSVMEATIGINCVRRSDGSLEYCVALVDDVTDRKRTEAALRDSEARFRSLISQVKDYAIFATDARGLVTTWNEGCEHVLGYAEAEFVGLDSAELFTPEDQAEGVPAVERHQAAETGTAMVERWMMAKGGTQFFAMGATTALRDATGRLAGFSTVMRDVTAMKVSQDELAHHGESLERLVTERTRELENTTERLRLSERMASLGTLSAGLGHDMGNLLLPLDIRLKLLLDANLPPELREHVIGIRTCAQYLQRLSSGLRLLAVDPWAAPLDESTELRAWWTEVGMMFRSVLPPGVQLAEQLPAHECRVAIGRVALTQAVFNLVHNAGDSLRERGTGRVEVGAREDYGDESVVVRVTDDGPGMAEDVVRRCMEPYFSTKARDVSTGLGLPFVRGLVTAVGGRIDIDSVLGRGTTISLILPAAPPDEPVGDEPPRIALVGLSDMRLRSFIAGQLRTLGMEVRTNPADVEVPMLVVADDATLHAYGDRAAGAPLVVIGDGAVVRGAGGRAGVERLGAHPDADAISRALRDAAAAADRDR